MNIIVTGASRGIGFALVKNFCQAEGNRVFAISRNRKKLEQLKNECKAFASPLFILDVDISEEKAAAKIKLVIDQDFHKIDVLINNAGLLVNKPFAEIDRVDFTNVLNTNLWAPVQLIQLLMPYFTLDAHVVNIGSMGGVQGSVKFPGLSLYSASKGALAILTECLAEEYKESGIRFNCLALGSAQTEMLEEAFPGYKAPLSAIEMATFIADFAIHGSKIFNGKVLPVAVTTP